MTQSRQFVTSVHDTNGSSDMQSQLVSVDSLLLQDHAASNAATAGFLSQTQCFVWASTAKQSSPN